MKTGLLTFHAAHHYGAQLQAWALMSAIRTCGSDCEIIHYVRKDTEDAKRLYRRSISPRNLLANAHTLLHHGALRRRADRFERFVAEHMTLSPKAYPTYAALEADAPVYDAYVCGSDQVWNPLIYHEQTYDPAFFAGFATSGLKIAYAPSFGISEIPAEHQEGLRKHVAGFSALSSREKSGVAILNTVCNREATVVLDPTLLLDDAQWRTVAASPQKSEPYLLCYFISDGAPYAPFVEAVARSRGLRVVSLCGSRRTLPGTSETVLDAGPREFLGLFADAAFVMTDSFHGTVFSINFGKEFFSFSFAESGKKKVSTRLDSILGILGLRERLLTDAAESVEQAVKRNPIDWKPVRSALAEERAQSIGYLRNALFPNPAG